MNDYNRPRLTQKGEKCCRCVSSYPPPAPPPFLPRITSELKPPRTAAIAADHRPEPSRPVLHSAKRDGGSTSINPKWSTHPEAVAKKWWGERPREPRTWYDKKTARIFIQPKNLTLKTCKTWTRRSQLWTLGFGSWTSHSLQLQHIKPPPAIPHRIGHIKIPRPIKRIRRHVLPLPERHRQIRRTQNVKIPVRNAVTHVKNQIRPVQPHATHLRYHTRRRRHQRQAELLVRPVRVRLLHQLRATHTARHLQAKPAQPVAEIIKSVPRPHRHPLIVRRRAKRILYHRRTRTLA